MLPALWALRNLAYGNEAAKTKIGKKEGVPALLDICCNEVSLFVPPCLRATQHCFALALTPLPRCCHRARCRAKRTPRSSRLRCRRF